ncbi:MAG: DNA alkylation repair protein [Chloroflexi bacterium]|nr:DNA alkylation repair protein [Chloroflexota bacterium]
MAHLKSLADPHNVDGMARFGISPKNTLGVSIPTLRGIAKSHQRNHALALELWDSRIHEARILASFVDDPKFVTEAQMESWANVFDSWDVCDQVCSNLFDKTKFAYQKADEWSRRSEEFVKRAGFVLMASLAVHDKTSNDETFEKWFPLIIREAGDERNFVRKAVNWALRQIGKRNGRLCAKAIKVARELSKSESKSARWIGKDALRELENKKSAARK